MKTLENIERPTKKEQETALASYDALNAMLYELDIESPEIEIEETGQKIKIPLRALKLLATILEATSKGQPISIVPIATELTTQAAAEMLGCSRPHFVALLESGEIPFTKVGKHRRVKFEDVRNFKNKMRQQRKEILVGMMQGAGAIGEGY